MAFHINDLAAVPNKPWVYFFYSKKEEILYIWKAKNLKNRVKQYFAPGSMWKQDMLSKATRLDFIIVHTESEALYLEDNLIKKHKPPYNSLLKADNSYVYIKITKDPYPMVFTTRSRVADGWVYIWPKHFTRDLYKLLQFLRQLLRYRGCTNSVFKQWKICSDYHFGLCKWRCVYARIQQATQAKKNNKDRTMEPVNAAFKPEMTYDDSIDENKQIVKMIVDFFGGKTKVVEDAILSQMNKAVEKHLFEHAAQLRDIYGGISRYTERQRVVIADLVTWKVMKIRKAEWWYVVSIVNMFEGKMIDVIRLKYRDVDTDIDDIVSDFRSEYWDAIVDTLPNWVFVYSTSLKKIAKKTRTDIEQLLDSFIDAQIASSTFEKENVMNDLLKWLQDRYQFPRFPYAIECVDISHLSWGRTSGALVSLKEWLPNKKWYRRYKIQWSQQSDDYAALRDVLVRRFQWVDLEKDFIPDIFVIDWWKWQLWVIASLIDELPWFKDIVDRVWFCSLGKWDARKRAGKMQGAKEELYWFSAWWAIVSAPFVYDDVDRLLTWLRDEAHRFANQYRKKQMSMEFSGKKLQKKQKSA
jgi:excinuclease ABC subunit C